MKLKTKIGVVSMVSLNLSGVVAGSVIASIANSFPEVPIANVQLLTTLPGLGSLIITLIAGQLALKFSKKNLSLLGIFLITVGGLLPSIFNHSIPFMMLCSIILGAGLGFVTTINPMLVSEYFDGEERSSVMGMSTGATALGGMLLMAIGGMLGAQNWRHLYWVFAIGILVFLLVLFCLPKDHVVEFDQGNEKTKQSLIKNLVNVNPNTLYIFIAIFVMGIAYNAYMANLAIIITQKAIGDVAVIGMINAVGTIGGVLSGFGFSFIRKMTKPNTLAFGFLMTSLSLIITYFAYNIILLCIGAVFSGIGMVAVMASAPFLLSMMSKPQYIPIVMSIFAFINGLAGALAPKFISVLGIDVGGPSILFGAIITAIVAIVLFVLKFGSKAENGKLLQE